MSDGFIYIAVSSSGLVKLGHSTNPERRVVALRSPLGERATLLFYWDASVYTERMIHDHLRDTFSVSGEWYPASVRELIRGVQDALARSAADRIDDLVRETLRQAKKRMVSEVTSLAVDAWGSSEPLNADDAAMLFAALGRSVADEINEHMETVTVPARLVRETVHFVDPTLAEEALSR